MMIMMMKGVVGLVLAGTGSAFMVPQPRCLAARLDLALPATMSWSGAENGIPRRAFEMPVGPDPGPLSVNFGGKNLNLNGLAFAASMALWVTVLYPLVLTCAAISIATDKKRRRLMDGVVSLWARLSMLFVGYSPKVVGAENLPPRDRAVMYIPNHCSYLDILTLSGFLGRPFKYISKIEVLRIPLIGWAMGFAGHIALKRADRRSQLETYKQAVGSLKDGNSLVVFAEGTRSSDGRLKSFKRGPFKMAIDAGVDIVPVALCDLARFHPPSAIMPLKRPTGVEMKIFPAISTAGKDADDLIKQCTAAVNGALPSHQKALAN